jgi:hypothetical protein
MLFGDDGAYMTPESIGPTLNDAHWKLARL